MKQLPLPNTNQPIVPKAEASQRLANLLRILRQHAQNTTVTRPHHD